MTLSTIEGIGCLPNITDSETTVESPQTVDADAVHIAAQAAARDLAAEHHEISNNCREPLFLFIIETVCISWFTIEYLIRVFAAPDRYKFFKGVLNTIDLIAIVPFYISIALETMDTGNLKNLKSVRKAVQVFRVLRIMRILKLARHSTGLQSLGYTLKRSYKELSMLLMFLAIFILLFSSLAYFAEKDGNAIQFRSIPHAFWWASIVSFERGNSICESVFSLDHDHRWLRGYLSEIRLGQSDRGDLLRLWRACHCSPNSDYCEQFCGILQRTVTS